MAHGRITSLLFVEPRQAHRGPNQIVIPEVKAKIDATAANPRPGNRDALTTLIKSDVETVAKGRKTSKLTPQ